MKIPLIYNRILILFFFIANIIILDQVSKKWIINNLLLHEKKPLISIMNIFYVRNYGTAFNFFSNNPGEKNYILCLISSIAILIILKTMYNNTTIENFFYNIPSAFIISGAIGNFIDRCYLGYVIDFIDFHINNWHFATFNIADVSIFIGSVLFIYHNKYFLKN
ncbi:lipoprotein signal peptidase [Buchnera aphidicola str. Bp (Baizongia pistaciae)]|uniref:Lipoprotein signal peptidase n=1 Tax=Buchnera aphidicola subsp. Baizongia pistaciae (strain Bp) TaxID=224915 RepID=LSPA_BUCBP|nr:signal peptidase II [Buchnera aphidicola]Q89AV0.1 RecName: Full=Lipoprotein signal peptidase; AltName: Full=Prolipoprotein signal peptidase; AltName: Full=Signal peptidase II; Short=SPase II [Buchnera aphidicola str. Bp (Baizongia pistaciae)]AAO26872.1 lipoprotein signal peptidase [Buchnera aphidicola str. Bp (Baizongia pistaciae)]